MKFEILASGYGLVEGPTEDAEGGIAFSDALGGSVYRVDAAGAVTTLVPKRRGVGGIALHADGVVVCSGRDLVRVRRQDAPALRGPAAARVERPLPRRRGPRLRDALRLAVFDPNAHPVPGECDRIDKELRGCGLRTCVDVAGAPIFPARI
jgi:hypothetical protein